MTERIPVSLTCQKTEPHKPHQRLWLGYWLDCPGDHERCPYEGCNRPLLAVTGGVEGCEVHGEPFRDPDTGRAVNYLDWVENGPKGEAAQEALKTHEARCKRCGHGSDGHRFALAVSGGVGCSACPNGRCTSPAEWVIPNTVATKRGPAVAVTPDLIAQAKADAPHSPEEYAEAVEYLTDQLATQGYLPQPDPEAPLEGAQSAPEALRDKMWQGYRAKRWQALKDVLDAQHEGALSVNARNSLANALEKAMTAFSREGGDLLFNQALERGTKLGHQVEELNQEVARLKRTSNLLSTQRDALEATRDSMAAEIKETRVAEIQAGLAQKAAEAEAEFQRGAKAKWKRKAGDLARSVDHWREEFTRIEGDQSQAMPVLWALVSATTDLLTRTTVIKNSWDDADEMTRGALLIALQRDAEAARPVIVAARKVMYEEEGS